MTQWLIKVVWLQCWIKIMPLAQFASVQVYCIPDPELTGVHHHFCTCKALSKTHILTPGL